MVTLALAMLDSGPSRRGSHALIEHVDRHRALWSALLGGGAAGIMRQGILKRLPRDVPVGIEYPSVSRAQAGRTALDQARETKQAARVLLDRWMQST